MVFRDKYKHREDFSELLHLNQYQKYWLGGVRNPKFDQHSGLILDVKEGKEKGIAHFHGILEKVIAEEVAIAVVPSHDPATREGGLRELARRLVAGNRIDATECLVRTYKIDKLATGGSRELQVHLKSIVVVEPDAIDGVDVLLLDDVSTSGNSIEACKQLLMRAGAARVLKFVLGKTA